MDAPEQITLPPSTMRALDEHPGWFDELDEARETGGVAAMIEWLNAHGLAWRPGGCDPLEAFADAMASGVVEFGGPLFEGNVSRPAGLGPNRAARRKAQRAARRRSR